MKKLLTTLVLSVLLFQAPAQAYESTFWDVDMDHDQYVPIEYLVAIDTLKGYSDGSFKPDDTINRAELMKILVAGQGIEPDASVYRNCFDDVSREWFARYICYAAEQGWVEGYSDGSFLPGNTVNKVEAAKMIVNGMGYAATLPTSTDSNSTWLHVDVDVSSWYVGYTRVIKAWNLDFTGDYFYPSAGMTRGLVAQYLYRIFVTEAFGSERYTERDSKNFLTYVGMDYILEADVDEGSSDEGSSDESGSEEVWLNIDYSNGVVTVENLGDVDVNLSGYTLETAYDVLYEFNSYMLYSGSDVDVEVEPEGNTVYLHDPYGGIIDSDFAN